ncbi:MAG: TIM barrel protein, partial [Verrucomicrobiota bacterium]
MQRKDLSPLSADRRDFLLTGGFLTGAGFVINADEAGAQEVPAQKTFKLCLNMSTIRGQALSAAEEIEVAGKAGYDSIEPWFRNINAYVEGGGSLEDLKKRIDDHGLTVESAIGFAAWAVNDEAKRAAGLEEAKRDMDTLAQLGGVRLAAPPAGIKKGEVVDLDDVADRYRVLLELGDEMGVVPQVEMWGGHPTIGTVEKALYVAIKAGHPDACFLG